MLGACSGASCPEWEEFQRAFKITHFPLITAADVGPSSSDLGTRPQSQLLDWTCQEKNLKNSQVTASVTDQRHDGCVKLRSLSQAGLDSCGVPLMSLWQENDDAVRQVGFDIDED